MSRRQERTSGIACFFLLISPMLAAAVDKTQRKLVLREPSPTSVDSVAVSRDGALIAAASGAHIRFYDQKTGSLLRMSGATGDRSVVFSPDGKTLTAAGFHMDKVVKMFDVETGSLVGRYLGHTAIEMYATAISPDGKLLASACRDHEILVWEISTRKLLYQIDGAPAIDVAFSPDSKTLAAGCNDKQIRLWDAKTGQLQRSLSGHSDCVVTIAFSPDGTALATGSCDWVNHRGRDMANFSNFVPSCISQLKLWDLKTGEVKRSVDEPGRLLSVAFAPDGKSAVCAIDRQIRRYGLGSRDDDSVVARFDFGITSVAFIPDGTSIVCGSHDHTVRRISAATGQIEWRTAGSHEQINSVAVTPDRSLLVTGSSDTRFSIRTLKAGDRGLSHGTARLWDAQTGRLIRRLEGSADQVMAVSFSPNGNRIAVAGALKGGEGVIQVCDLDGTSVWSKSDHGQEVVGIAYSPDGTLLASAGAEGTVILRDAETSTVLQTLSGHDGGATSVSFSSDGVVIACGDGRGGLKIWDTKTGRLLHTCSVADSKASSVHNDRLMTSIAFIPDSMKLYSCAATVGNTFGDPVRQWDAQTGEMSHVPKMSGRPIVLSPDGKTLAAGGKTIQLFEMPSGNKSHRLTGHMKKIQAIAFSRDGQLVYGGGSYGTLNIWEAATGQLLVSLFVIPEEKNGRVSDHWLAYRPDGHYDGSPGIERFLAWQIEDQLQTGPQAPELRSADQIHSALKIRK